MEIKFSNDCQKMSYPTLKDARTVLNNFRANRGKRIIDRIYRCEICNAYHFTSKPLIEETPEELYKEPKFINKWLKLLNDNETIL